MGKARKFVIQKHDASNLHYDFRLEMADALASWAVPKGLSPAANEKRLAVRTEDHEKEWMNFEGVVPEDEYGGGTVMVWDRGTYELLDTEKDDLESLLEDGSFKIRLEGEKLAGGWALARTGRKGGKEHWIIFKLDDDEADARRKPTSTQPDSVKTGRSIEEIEEEES